MGTEAIVIPSPPLTDTEKVEKYERDYKRLEDFLVIEFPLDISEGERLIDRALDLLKRYKRLLMATSGIL